MQNCVCNSTIRRRFGERATTSKAFTAIGIMRLVEQGQLEFDLDMNDYLKTFHVPANENHPITVRQLLSHTSGLDDPFVGSGFLDSGGSQPTLATVMRHWLPRRVYEPGDVYFYSNFGYGVLGALIGLFRTTVLWKDSTARHVRLLYRRLPVLLTIYAVLAASHPAHCRYQHASIRCHLITAPDCSTTISPNRKETSGLRRTISRSCVRPCRGCGVRRDL